MRCAGSTGKAAADAFVAGTSRSITAMAASKELARFRIARATPNGSTFEWTAETCSPPPDCLELAVGPPWCFAFFTSKTDTGP